MLTLEEGSCIFSGQTKGWVIGTPTRIFLQAKGDGEWRNILRMHILVRSALIPLYYFEDDYFYSIFKRKKFEEERASFYKQQLLTPLRNQSLGGRKSKCKALYEL